jgi:alkyl sulfatase BDS1-like metallo-beta-lactamase superfamily hydrolase
MGLRLTVSGQAHPPEPLVDVPDNAVARGCSRVICRWLGDVDHLFVRHRALVVLRLPQWKKNGRLFKFDDTRFWRLDRIGDARLHRAAGASFNATSIQTLRTAPPLLRFHSNGKHSQGFERQPLVHNPLPLVRYFVYRRLKGTSRLRRQQTGRAMTPRLWIFSRCLIAFAALVATPVAALAQPKAAEPPTREANAALLTTLPFADREDFIDARRGFVATIPDAIVAGPGGRPAWSMKAYDFLKSDEAPSTVNPSLWRQAQLNAIHGLFKVTDRVYQVRGFDIANMTIIEGEQGIVVLDTLLTAETGHAALELYYENRPRRPVVAVIYSHSHADHFGGVKGVVDAADVASGRVRIYAPEGFMEHAVAENVIAGNAMSRRAQYMYGPLLPPGERGQVDTGLGKNLALGTITLLAPTDLIGKTLDERVIDGIDIVFQLTPGTEAPAEMNLYFPQFRVLDMAENVTHTMHNLYTLRGAEIRDGNLWSRYINEALEQFGGRSDVLIAQHHWPVWGTDRIVAAMKKQRDLYKFINDQSLRLLNQGLTPGEIAEVLRLPASLAGDWSLRGYYGTLRHNARAVYQKYLGWYDGNPADLDPLPPAEAARKRIDYMGGADAVIARAGEDFKAGNYRWVASVMNDVVFADPSSKTARELEADALEQLGYQAEAGTWRNEYLMGAFELRNGIPQLPATTTLTPDTVKAVSLELFFDFLGVRLDAARAEGKKMVINWNFTDLGETYALTLQNTALTWSRGAPAPEADASLTLTRATLDVIVLKQISFPDAVKSGRITLEGDATKPGELLSLFDEFKPMFAIVSP